MSTLQSQTFGDSKQSRIELTGKQDVRVAAELQRSLIEHLAFHQPTIVDCSQVDLFDAAALQVLLAAKRETADKLAIFTPLGSEAATWLHISGLEGQLKPANSAC